MRAKARSASSSFRRRRPKASRSCAPRARSSRSCEPAFCSVTFGAGGSTREGHARDGARDARRKALPSAPHISCIGGSRRIAARRAGAVPRARHRPSRRAARRPAFGHGRRGRVSLRERPRRRSSARKRPRTSTSTSRAIPSTTRRRAARRRTSTTSSARCARAPTRRSRSTSSTATRTGASSTPARRAASRFPSCRASCPSTPQRGSRASRTRAAPRFRAGSGASSRGSATTRRRSARSASTW